MARLSRFLLLTTSIAGLSGAAAQAADMPVVVAQPAAFGWSGFYIGANGGYGFSGRTRAVNLNQTFAATFPFFNADVGSLDTKGGFGGIQFGRNVQFGRLVLGLEVDAQWGDIKGHSAGSVPYLAPGGVLNVTTRNSVTAFGTVRPRIGVTWDNALLYATGGAAWGNIHHAQASIDNFGFAAVGGKSVGQFGYAVGGGVEYAFSRNLSAKVEYLYVDLGSVHQKDAAFWPAFLVTAFADATPHARTSRCTRA